MTRRRKTLVALAIVLLLGAVCGALVWLACRDDPPPDDADLRVHREAIPDDQNAFACFEAAGKAAAWPRGLDTPEDRLLDGRAWDAALVEKTLDENHRALDLWEQGLARPRFQVPQVTSSSTPMPWARGWSLIPCIATLRGLHLAKTGRPEEAFQEAMKVVQFGHRIEGAKGCLVVWLVGATVKQTGLDRLRRLAAETPLPPERLRAYVDRLTSLRADTVGLADALRADYVLDCSAVDDLKAGNVGPDYLMDLDPFRPMGAGAPRPRDGRVLDPIARSAYHFKPNRTKALFAEYVRSYIEQVPKLFAEGEPNLDRLRDQFHDRCVPAMAHRIKYTINGVGQSIFLLLTPPLNGLNKFKCSENAAVAATRLILAIRAFDATHGRLPDALDELVPAFIDAVPADDFDGKSMRWSKEKRIVYSVGPDLVDDGGHEATTAWEQSKDLVYHLDPRDAPRLDEEEESSADGPQEAPAEAP